MGIRRWLPFFKTYVERCSDGTTRTVYRNVNDAFPLEIRDMHANLVAEAKVQAAAEAQLQGGYAKIVRGLHYQLNEWNESLMIEFRIAYTAYQGNPCEGWQAFQRAVARMLELMNRLRGFRAQIAALAQLANSMPEQQERFLDLYCEIVKSMGVPEAPVATSRAIAESQEAAREMLGEHNGS